MAHLAHKRKCQHCNEFFHPDHRNVAKLAMTSFTPART